MATLTVDRLHAAYVGVDAAAAEQLDAALATLTDEALDAALRGLSLTDAFAVCIPSLHVVVDLDARHPVDALASAWADAVVAGLEAALAGGVASGVLVWRRPTDALIDLVGGVAAGDETRRWAWQQAGLVPAGVGGAPLGPDEVADALCLHPEAVPAVLQAAVAGVIPVPLTPSGWRRVAWAFGRARSSASVSALASVSAGSLPLVSAGSGSDSESESGSGSASAGPGSGSRPGPAAALVARAAAMVPAAAWPADRSPSDPAAVALARLALAVVAPAWSGDDTAVAAVLAAADAEERVADRPSEVSVDPPEPPAAVRSAWAGVCFLAHDLLALDWSELVPSPELLLAVLPALTGAPVDDPAVRLLTGADDDVEAFPADDPVAVGLVAALHARLDARFDDDGDDRTWIWARPGTIESAPGWVEVVLSLDDVDIRLRRAGLDLDPGYLWWLGSVLRFRYA